MKTKLLLTVFLLIVISTFGQTSKSQYLGINILQLPALTINANYSLDITPYFISVADVGYTFNYVKAEKMDLPGRYLTSHTKKLQDSENTSNYFLYNADQQSGGYL